MQQTINIPTKRFDHIIIGGGIIGSSLAFHLGKNNDVLLIDADHEGKATNAGAGIISGATTFSDNEDMYKLVMESSKYYPEFIRKLKQHTDIPTSYQNSKQIICVSKIENIPEYEKIIRRIRERQIKYDYPESDSLFEIDSGQIKNKYPFIGNAKKMMMYTDAAQIDGRQLVEAIKDASKSINVQLLRGLVDELVIDENDDCKGVVVEDTKIYASNTIIAGGAWSSVFSDQLGYRINIFPQRGQIIHCKLKKDEKWPIVVSLSDYYSLSFSSDHIVIGATRESQSGFDPRNTVVGTMNVLTEGINLLPEIENAEIMEIRVGLRPYSKDGLPIIGPVPNVTNVWIVTGHGPLGLTSGPFTGKLVADIIDDKQVNFDLSPFDPKKV